MYCSGCIALDAATMTIIEGDVADQCRKALQNMRAILEGAGSSMAKVVKCTVLLRDMGDFKAINTVYAGTSSWMGMCVGSRCVTCASFRV